MLRVFIPKERQPGETRVAATPETVRRLVKEGMVLTVELGAGASAHIADDAYGAAGSELVAAPHEGYAAADVVLKVAPLCAHPELPAGEAEALRPGALLVGLLDPYRERATIERLAARGVSALAMELIPRISRAQSMDALSSQASIAGYKAVLLAAARLDKYFPLLMTAAGTIAPARVVVMGAGVAGLQAVATAKRLGAVVEVSDIRPAVKEQVESLGGKFIALPIAESGEGAGGYAREMSAEFLARQRAVVKEHVAAADVVITTALVPGKRAPLLVTADMVEAMRPGAVIVDLAVEQGGNCELAQNGETIEHRGVQIVGPRNLAASVPADASLLYARNLQALMLEIAKGAELRLERENEIVAGALLTHGGSVVHPAFGAPRGEGAS